MEFLVDVRYVFPPLINLTLWVLIPQAKAWAVNPNFNSEIFVMTFLSLVIAILVFLFTSVKLPLTIGVELPQLKAGDFSAPLTLSLFASLFFPSDIFGFVFPLLIILSPWYGSLSDLMKRIIFWFSDALQTIPALIITCIRQYYQTPQNEHGAPQVELEEIVIEETNEV
jgi:hypothetical protein